MSFVIDASIAACWLMPDEHHPIADAAQRRIIHEPAMTPGAAVSRQAYQKRNVDPLICRK
jgi:hypothetical protein